MKQVPKGGEVKTKSHSHRWRWRSPFLLAVAAVATFLLARLIIVLIDELLGLIRELR